MSDEGSVRGLQQSEEFLEILKKNLEMEFNEYIIIE